jgi:excinuclease UvrABC ATPase subunit
VYNAIAERPNKPETIRIADHVIDLGPGAGHDGGRIVFTGTPADLVENASTLTAQHLRVYVGG